MTDGVAHQTGRLMNVKFLHEPGPVRVRRQSEEAIRRRLVKNLKKTKEAGCGYELSLSVGTARFDPKHPLTLGELLLQADKVMYEQKRKRQATPKDSHTAG